MARTKLFTTRSTTYYTMHALRLTINVITIVTTLLLYPLPSSADILKLLDGDKITGRLIQLSSTECEFKTKHLGVLHVKISLISGLDTDNIVTVKMASGEIILGQITSLSEKILAIQSPYLSVINIPIDRIVSVHDQNLQELQEENKGNGRSEYSDDKKNYAEKDKTGAPNNVPEESNRHLGKSEKEESPPQTFLRGSAVLIEPGQIETSLGIRYIPKGPGRFTQSTFGATFGILDRFEAWVAVPATAGWGEISETKNVPKKEKPKTNKELNSDQQSSHVKTDWYCSGGDCPEADKPEYDSVTTTRNVQKVGLSDIAGGIRYLLKSESATWPETTISFSMTAPTGGEGLSDRTWVPSVGLSFAKSTDPAILFWGASYSYVVKHDFTTTKEGEWIDPICENGKWTPGYYEKDYPLRDHMDPFDRLTYYSGMGFAINERLSVSGRVVGIYTEKHTDSTTRPKLSTDQKTTDPKTDDKYKPKYKTIGPSEGLIGFVVGLSYRAFGQIVVEPAVTLGLGSENALSFTVSRKF